MKKALIMISLLSAVCANMHAMDGGEQQLLIAQYEKDTFNISDKGNKDNLPPAYEPPSAYATLKPQSASAPVLEDVDLEAKGSVNSNNNNNNTSTRLPTMDPSAFYNGNRYPQNTITYGQIWKAYDVPEGYHYMAGPLLDTYLDQVEKEELQENCSRCIGQTCCCLCVAGAVAGVITGLVYCCRSQDDGWDYDWQPNQPPFAPTSMQSYSQSMTQIVTALVSKSKKME